MDQRRQRLYRTPAIVLKRQDFGEADRILTLFTPELGKLRVIAKGVRKITSRKSGHVELFTYSNLLIAKGRNLDIVTQAETIRPFRPLREDLSRITYAYYIAELVDQFTEERDENRPLFDLLLATLQALGETNDLRRTARYFELRLLDAVGYRPQLFRCVQCNSEIEPVDNFFGIEAGGVLCPSCIVGRPDGGSPAEPFGGAQDGFPAGPALRERHAEYEGRASHVQPLSLNALKVLRFMQREPPAVVNKLKVRRETHREMERLMHRYLTHLLERDLKSVEFLGMLAASGNQ
ncbi:MAG: DNA repair protein RecO [Chloroflexi bacterium]|nr:MAG: DNA repair protein RecO [Chloroflexota bacterium]